MRRVVLLAALLLVGCAKYWEVTPEKCINETDQADKDKCWHQLAYFSGDPSYCLNVKNRGLWDDCFYTLAVQKKNIKLCEPIFSQITKQMCENSVKGVV